MFFGLDDLPGCSCNAAEVGIGAMAKPSREIEAEWQSRTVDVLLSYARKIAGGTDDWADRNHQAAFLGRVAAGEDPLGDQYSAAYTAEERRGTGATLTPMPIVRAMVEWATRQTTSLGTPERIVDCGAGTGRFAIAAARVF